MADDDDDDDDTSPELPREGWRAIDAALAALHPGKQPLPLEPVIPWRMGGTDPLDRIAAFPSDGPPAHWHLVSYGLSELYEKESEDDQRSGYGFELTMRLPRANGDKLPPEWALKFLNRLARYVIETGNPFGPGHYMDLNGPIARSSPTAITAVAFAPDPLLPGRATPNGRVEFLQVVGLTKDELELAQSWDTERLLSELAGAHGALLVTDVARASLLADPERSQRIRARAGAEGSSQGTAYVPQLDWSVQDVEDEEHARLRLGAIAVPGLRRMLEGRILHGRKCLLEGDREVVVVEPTTEPASWAVEEQVLVLRLDPNAARAMLRDLEPRRGTWRWSELPGLRLVVMPTPITSPDGEIIETIG